MSEKGTEYSNFKEDTKNKSSVGQVVNKSINSVAKSNVIDPSQVLQKDIAKSSYFTINFNGMFADAQFTVPGGAFGKNQFLPVKSITLSYGSVESINIPVACYSDVPIINKRRIGKITLEMYDLDDDRIENGFRAWMKAMTVDGRSVYLSEVACPMSYRSYNVKGQLNENSITPLVIPIGELEIHRSYENNTEKLIRVNLAIVGNLD